MSTRQKTDISVATLSDQLSPWPKAKVRDVGQVQLGRQRSPKHAQGEHMRPYLRVANVYEDRIDLSDVLEMNFTPAEFETFALRPGDILLNEGQSLEWVGRPAMYCGELPGACFQNTLVRFRPGPQVDGRFALFVFRWFLHSGQFQAIAKWTTNIAHLGAGRCGDMEMPLPPLPEQRRIVAEIEAQFTKLDAGVAALKRVQANLKRYRAAVLKAACEGKLVPTEAELRRTEGRRPKTASIPREGATFRAAGARGVQGVVSSSLTDPTEFETGEQLLQRILAERRRQCEEANSKSKIRNRKYQEPAAPDTSNLPPLPEGWAWASVAQIGESTTGFTPPKGDSALFGGDIPFFKPTDLDYGYNVRDFRDSLTARGAEHGRLLPARTVLVTCIGATIGNTGLARVECATNQQINALTVPTDLVLPEYVYWVLSSPFGQQQIKGNASATTLPILNKSKFEALNFPLPPLAEQTRIVAEVEHRLSVIDELETLAATNLARATRLRQAVLQQVFTGES